MERTEPAGQGHPDSRGGPFDTRVPPLVGFHDRDTLLSEVGYRRAAASLLAVHLDQLDLLAHAAGRAAAERVAVDFARRLLAAVGTETAIARHGERGFLLLAETGGLTSECESLARRVAASAREPFRVAGRDVPLTASVGFAFVAPASHPDDALADAEVALARARAAGGGRIEGFDAGLRVAASWRLDLEAELSGALERGELRLQYQPLQQIDTGEIVGAEALLRWAHPQYGLMPPERFLSFAEEVGLILPIGAWVLTEACAAAVRLRRVWPRFDMAVNVSPRQIAAPGFVETVTTALAATGLPPDALVLEVTESLPDEAPDAATVLRRLVGRGVRISIDDFGTGYSTLRRTRTLPAEMIKIDRSFVASITDDTSDARFVEALIAFAHSVGLRVVAEGVETEGQLLFLRGAGCDLAQGFLLARPLDEGELLGYLEPELARAVINVG